MTKTKILKWRLSEKPSADNISQLVKDGILTKEEAKEIILGEAEEFSSEIENEIKLLRKLVQELADKTGKTTEIIRIVEREIPIYKRSRPYYEPWTVWCSSNAANYTDGSNTQNSTLEIS